MSVDTWNCPPADMRTARSWPIGTTRFLHSDDMADACLHLLEHYDGADQVNVGSGTDVTIREIAEAIASVVGYTGARVWDSTKPDGIPQKLLDVSKLAQVGWTSKTSLQEGLERTLAWYRDHVGALRGIAPRRQHPRFQLD
jgi:GDP-L-fucose synthase